MIVCPCFKCRNCVPWHLGVSLQAKQPGLLFRHVCRAAVLLADVDCRQSAAGFLRNIRLRTCCIAASSAASRLAAAAAAACCATSLHCTVIDDRPFEGCTLPAAMACLIFYCSCGHTVRCGACATPPSRCCSKPLQRRAQRFQATFGHAGFALSTAIACAFSWHPGPVVVPACSIVGAIPERPLQGTRMGRCKAGPSTDCFYT